MNNLQSLFLSIMRFAADILISGLILSAIQVMTVQAETGFPAQSPTAIHDNQYVQGQFKMDRYFADRNIPLQSTGSFILAPATGLIWQTEIPFPTTTVLSDQGIVRIDDQGNLEQLVRGNHFRQFVQLISAVLSGNWGALASRFDISHTIVENNQWQITLTARNNSQIASQIRQIIVTGDKFVHHARLEKPFGDRDEITLFNRVVNNLPLPEKIAETFSGKVN